ncbi:hypothetical protein [Legionella moravica]|uniref:hypothetical protein n=1 Tax=Legionella moravica TaxID=39962 RepID=UPI000415DBF4|nr:hypothetical protein [Legionella moravica]
MKPESIREQVLAYDPELVIGADGTHSVTNQALFPKDNRIHYEIDYAMQVRLEIDGKVDANLDQTVQFYQRLAHHGLIATEQVGRLDPKTGKTPVTMQIIIPKEDYMILNGLKEKPNAQNPIKPFGNELEYREIPDHLQTFIDSYLYERLKLSGSNINPHSIRISVNELPASRVTETFTHLQNPETHKDVFVSLNGDSALGLSYFKGLNAGLEASAKFFTCMAPAIVQGLKDKNLVQKSLDEYQSWFSVYAEQKVGEVRNYSAVKIGSSLKVIKGVQGSKVVSAYIPEVDKKPIIDAYYHLLARANPDDVVDFRPYPHRSYDPDIQLGQFGYVPVHYTMKKTTKIFADFFKPYKSGYQVMNDFKQPFTGVVNVFMGITKSVLGIGTLSPTRILDGGAHLLRGVIELAMTPLTFLVKPFVRGVLTLFSSYKKIEENTGVQHLVDLGTNLLESQEEKEELSFDKMQQLLGICNDLHRKFNKSVQRGQDTQISSSIEREYIKRLTDTASPETTSTKFKDYLTLFKGPFVAADECKQQQTLAL